MTPSLAWVTGASGFIGGHVVRRFRALGWTVVGIDRIAAPADFPCVTGEVSPASLIAAENLGGIPDAVFHGAGNGSVGRSLADPAMCRRDTLDSTLQLLAYLGAKAPACRLVFPSSAAVYGTGPDVALMEDRALAPISPYGHHKRAAEEACLAAAAAGQPVAILRMFSVYGPGLRKQLPWELGGRLVRRAPAVTLFGTGCELRDFFFVGDAARLIVRLATEALPSPVIVNGASGTPVTVADFARRLAKALGSAAEIAFNGESRAGDPPFYRADLTRLAALGFHAQTDLDAGLAVYADWLRRAVPADCVQVQA